MEGAAAKERPRGVFRDLANYMASRVALLALGFASFPLLTRMLTVPEYGVVSLVLRVVLVLTVLAKCGFQYSVGRFYHETAADGSPGALRRFYSTLVFSPMIVAGIVAFFFLSGLLLFSRNIHDPLLRSCLLMAPGLVLLRVLQSLLLGFLRNEGKSRLHGIFEVATKALTLAALIALFISPFRGGIGFLAASTASEACIVLIQLRLLVKRKLIHWNCIDWSLTRASLAFGAPLIAYEFSSVVLDSGDRFLVQHFLGATQLGYYSAAYNIASYFQDIVMSPMNLAFLPIYMKLWVSEGPGPTGRLISKALSWFLVLALFISSLTLLCSKSIVVLLASRRFLEAHSLLPIIIPGLMLYATHIFLNAGMIVTKRTGLMAGLAAISAAANIALNLYLIPHFGTVGAAYATLASYALLIALMAWINRRILPVRANWCLILSSLIAASVAWIAARQVNVNSAALSLITCIALGSALFAVILLVLSEDARAIVFAAWKRVRK